MANFGVMKITNLGLNLFAKAQTGTQIQFSKMQSGDGALPPGTVIETLTQLISPDFDVDIESITIDEVNHVAKIKGTKDNIGMLGGVFSREIGLFANDPDVGEVLYAYANAGEYPDYIPPESSGPYTKTFAINAAIGNAANVTAVIPLDIYVSQDTFNDFKDETSASLADIAEDKLDINGGVLESYSEKLLANPTTTGTVDIDLAVQNVFNLTLTGNTILTFSNPTANSLQSFTLIINQGGTARTVTFPASVKWANDSIPDLSTINKTSVLTFLTTDGGTRWYGFAGGLNFTT